MFLVSDFQKASDENLGLASSSVHPSKIYSLPPNGIMTEERSNPEKVPLSSLVPSVPLFPSLAEKSLSDQTHSSCLDSRPSNDLAHSQTEIADLSSSGMPPTLLPLSSAPIPISAKPHPLTQAKNSSDGVENISAGLTRLISEPSELHLKAFVSQCSAPLPALLPMSSAPAPLPMFPAPLPSSPAPLPSSPAPLPSSPAPLPTSEFAAFSKETGVYPQFVSTDGLHGSSLAHFEEDTRVTTHLGGEGVNVTAFLSEVSAKNVFAEFSLTQCDPHSSQLYPEIYPDVISQSMSTVPLENVEAQVVENGLSSFRRHIPPVVIGQNCVRLLERGAYYDVVNLFIHVTFCRASVG